MRLTSIADLAQKNGKTELSDYEKEWLTNNSLSRQYEAYMEDEGDDGHVRVAGVHASELNTCKRQVVYSLHQTPKKAKIQIESRKRFKIGHAIHHMLQSDFAKMADAHSDSLSFREEVKVHGTPLAVQYYIESSCDGVFHIQNEKVDVRIGIEIKSISPNDFASLTGPQQKHIEQAHVYMACLDLPLMWFIYWNKGNQNFTPMTAPWLITFNPDIWDGLKDRAMECLAAADAGQLPDREEGFHCSWCGYAWTCEPKKGGGGSRHPSIAKQLLRKIR
jgi:hypothetical protein